MHPLTYTQLSTQLGVMSSAWLIFSRRLGGSGRVELHQVQGFLWTLSGLTFWGVARWTATRTY